MAQFVNIFDVDLQAGKPNLFPLNCNAGEGDANGFRVGARVTDGGEYIALGGSCVGKVVRADGATVQLTGTISGNLAYVVLDQTSCAVEGPLQVAVCWVSSSNVTTLAVAYGTVVNTQTGSAIQPSTPVPDLTELLAEIDAMETATAAANAAATNALGNFAGAFSDATAYTVGQYVTYSDGYFYRFIVNHAAGAWSASDVEKVTTGTELDVLRRALASANAVNVLDLVPAKTMAVNGITYNWSAGVVTLSGTAGSNSVGNLLATSSGQGVPLPEWISPGDQLRVTADGLTSAIMLDITFNNKALVDGYDFYLSQSADITVPNDATVMRIRMFVNSGTAISGTKTVKLSVLNTLTNKQLEAAVAGLNAFEAKFGSDPFINHGILASGTDIDTVDNSGWYILDGISTYTHMPSALSGQGALLIVYAGTTAPVQTLIGINTGVRKLYQRSGRSSSFVGRDWVDMLTPNIQYKSGAKYVAFGDSITCGAVWSASSGTELHQVKNEWRIPTRIALATGMLDNYANEAVGGIGYLKEQDGQNLIGQISNYTFTDVELVTIMAGANDKSGNALGTYTDAATANTICGAIRNIIQTIATKNPKTQIIIIQPTPSGVDGNSQDVWSTVPSGWQWSMNQFDEQVSKLCHDEHVGYLNWWESTYCRNWKNVGYNGTTGPNYTHPTADFDYCLLGDFIAGKVSSIFTGLN